MDSFSPSYPKKKKKSTKWTERASKRTLHSSVFRGLATRTNLEQKRQSRRGCRRLPKNNWTCASFFVCLFVIDTSFPYIRLDCFTYIMQVFTYIMPVKCVPIKAIMRCCSNGVLALRTYARPHATCCYQNPFDVTIWWREFSNEPQISIIT